MTSAARQLAHLAVVFENAAAAQDALASGRKRKPKHSRAGQAAGAAKPRPRAEMWDAQQRFVREQETRMRETHAAAADADRRIDAIAERHTTEPRREPRIRGL